MLQVIQNLKSGDTILEEVPVPQVKSGQVLIQSHCSLVSLGTERMLVEFGKAGLLGKVRQQPEKVKEVIAKMQTDGIGPTVDAVRRKLDVPLPLGYSNAGTVIAVGKGVSEFKKGDRVVSNGCHAEYVRVSKNLVAKIPDEVTFEEAAFTVVGAIGLQGLRLVQPTFGETVVVTGLGLIGLLTVQLLKANGCRVIGIDLDDSKLQLAEEFGAETVNAARNKPVESVMEMTDNRGADAVVITASTSSNAVISQSAQMSRKRGRIVLVGVIGLDINRSDFYEKELSFQVSCSYGPGRYDPSYEDEGNDYPLAYVRWTEKRNFEAVLEALRSKQVSVKPLITEEVPLQEIEKIYGDIGSSKSIASLIQYPGTDSETQALKRTIHLIERKAKPVQNTIAVIGAGSWTQSKVLPSLKNTGLPVKYIVSSEGLSSTILAKKFNIEYSTTSIDDALNDSEVEGLIVTTRHNLHASMVINALEANKHVFVEKPLALNHKELDQIIEKVEESEQTVSVGFNRRFSPHALKIRELIGDNPGAMNIVATMNAGFIPADSWLQDPAVGGGRIIGEACHYIDLLQFISGSQIQSVCMQGLGTHPDSMTDNASIFLKMKNGTHATIHYFSNGNKSYPKEKIDIFYQGKNLVIDNFRKLHGYGFGEKFSSKLLRTKQDKGHKNQFEMLIRNWKKDGSPLTPFEDIVNTTRASFAAIESLNTRQWVEIKP